MNSDKLLVLNNINKSFSGVRVLEDINFDLHYGEVHCIVGQNGAGKSTLIKITSGAYQKDSGDIFLEGKAFEAKSPIDSLKRGISVIYQEVDVIPHQTVAENIYLGRELKKGKFFLDKQEMSRFSSTVLKKLNINISPDEYLYKLPIAKQQMVAIARSVFQKAKVMIMDEPSSIIGKEELGTLFQLVRQFKEMNMGIIYISHRLEEVFEIADRITVLRDGKVISTKSKEDSTENDLIQKMVGKNYGALFPEKKSKKSDKIILSLENVSVRGLINNISFDLCEGEILGLSGQVGSGRSEIVHTIYGDYPFYSGNIKVNNQVEKINSPAMAMNLGIGFIPEDRKLQSLFLDLPLFENTTFNSFDGLSKYGCINRKKQISLAMKRINELNITPNNPYNLVKLLSGGTQQKVVLSKWIFEGFRVLIMDEPTRGIDVGTKAEIFSIMQSLSLKGIGIIFISSEISEIIGVSHRILTVKEGRITATLNGQSATEEDVLKNTI